MQPIVRGVTLKTPYDIRVESWGELINELYAGSWQEGIRRYRSNFAFRGLSDKNYELKTSLIRLGDVYLGLESNLIRNFIKYARLESSSLNAFWNWLAMAQHHGLPTRLLDWTYSPFVAMHFATANISKFNIDGVIWCVDFVKTHRFLPNELESELMNEGSNVFTVNMLSNVSRSLEHFDKISKGDFALFFEPPSMDDRIINQFALHSVISNPKTILDDILAKHPELYKRVIIPSNLKWEIRDKLDQANMTERVMFPGLDGLSKWLTRHYSPSK
jgi:hypothetical protein